MQLQHSINPPIVLLRGEGECADQQGHNQSNSLQTSDNSLIFLRRCPWYWNEHNSQGNRN
jgi:hypothetical protein